MNIIPFKEPGAWVEQITLTNVIYNLYFRWNTLNSYWVMSIYDRDNNPLLLGVKVVNDWDLTQQFTELGLPAGDIICQSIIGGFDDITRFSMGQSEELIYYEPGEIDTVIEMIQAEIVAGMLQ